MPALEMTLRIAGSSELLMLAIPLLRLRGQSRAYPFIALFLFGIASYLLAPLLLWDWRWGYWAWPVIVMAILVPAFFWLLVHALFADTGPARGWPWPLIAVTALAGLVDFASGSGELSSACPHCWQWLAQSVKLLWVITALLLVLRDWRNDLVESRRRLRLLICAGAGTYILAVLVMELFIGQQARDWLELANVSLIVCLVTLFAAHLLVINPHNVVAAINAIPEVPAQPSAPAAISPLARDILEIVEKERFYARDATSIAALAAAVGSQQYLVRRAINQELGYRNFNTFMNQYRIEEIAHRLRQAEFAATPLLTLALDAGFRSLAPFNKAFKERFSMTPSDYRQQGVAD